MGHDTFRRFFHSVFAKLLVICLISGLVIIVLVGGFFTHLFRDSAQEHLHRNVLRYAQYVVRDLGSPPSFDRARTISNDSGIQIRYEGARGGWTTSEKVPRLSELSGGKLSCFFSGRPPGHPHAVVVRQGNDAFVISLRPEPRAASNWELQTAILLALLTAVVLMTFLAIRRILRPLKYLSEGVRQVSEGRLDYQIPTCRCTEFDRMADAFNTMTQRIRNMLRAKEQLLLDVSHELRSPLTRMKVALAMADDDPARKGMSEDVREMETMISEILEEARLRNAAGELRAEPIQVGELFSEMENLHGGSAPGLRTEPVPDGGALLGDLPLVRMVLNNVIANALKYSPSEGEPVTISFSETGDNAVIRVSDRGVGIPAEDLPHIFEPFYRVDKSRSKRTGGYGLGLSLCQTIMDAHRGRIEVESVFGTGTTISLLFPR